MNTTPEDRFDTSQRAYESLGARDAATGHPLRTVDEFHLGAPWVWYRDGYEAAAEQIRRKKGRDPSREPDAEEGRSTAATPKPRPRRYQTDYTDVLTTIPPQYRNLRTGETLTEKEYWKLPQSPEAEAAVVAAARDAVEDDGRMQRQDIAEHNGRLHVLEKDNTEARPRMARIEDGLRKQAARLTAQEGELLNVTKRVGSHKERMDRIAGAVDAVGRRAKAARRLAKRAMRILIGKSSMTSLNPPLLDQFYQAAAGLREFIRQHKATPATNEEKERQTAERDAHDGSIEKLTNNAMRDRIRTAGVEEGLSAVETRMTATEERLADVAEKVKKQVEAFNKVITNYSQRLADVERKAEAWKHDGTGQTLAQLRDLVNASVAEINLRIDHQNARADQQLQRGNELDQRLDGLAENVRKRLAAEVRADVAGAVSAHNATLPDGSIVSFIPKSKRDATGPITEEEEKVFLDNLKLGMPVADLVLLTGRGRTTITSYRDRFIADGKLERRDD